MQTLVLTVSLFLIIIGALGVVRSRIDGKFFTSRLRSLPLLILGTAMLFLISAPPILATGELEPIPPPPPAENVLVSLQEIIQQGLNPDADVLPKQQEELKKWRDQLTTAHKKADEILKKVEDIQILLNQGSIDRFTAWVRFSALSQDLKQTNLLMHDLIPPSKLDMKYRQSLQGVLDELQVSLDHKRDAIISLRQYTQTLDLEKLNNAVLEFERGDIRMTRALTDLARTLTLHDL